MSDGKAISRSKRLLLALRPRLRRLFLAAVDLYAALIVIYLLLRGVFGDRLWPVALFSTFLHYALLPAFVLLPVMLRVRRWPTAAMLAANVAAFLWLFGGLFFPQLSAPAHTGVLTVMTYNVADGSIAPDDLVSVLRDSGADIIALQELSDEQAAAIERDLGDLYPHQALYGYGVAGKGLLSRYPILEEELFYLEAHRLPYLRTVVAVKLPGAKRRGFREVYPPGSFLREKPVRASLAQGLTAPGNVGQSRELTSSPTAMRLPTAKRLDAFWLFPVDRKGWGQGVVDVTVIAAHSPPPGIGRLRYSVNPKATLEITSLAQMTTTGEPFILMGDFNMVDQHDNYHILADAGLKDAFRAAGWGFGATWPAHKMEPLWPLFRLDYIWYSTHTQAVRAWVGQGTGSDHLPVFAELAWRE